MSDSPTSLWIVARVYEPDEGGVQTYAREVARAYAAQGRRVTIFAKSSAGPRRIQQDGVDLIDVGAASMLTVYWRLFRAMLGAWLGGDRRALIHACTWRAALPALLFPRPLVVTVHGREVGRPRGVALLLLRLVLHRARRIVAVSDVTRTLLLDRLPHLATRTITAWNGVIMPADRASTAFARGVGGAQLLTVCRLVARKNIAAAVRAVAGCVQGGAHLRHVIIGRGIDSVRVRETIRHCGLDGTVTMAGYVSAQDLADAYAAADIFLHPQVAMEDGAEIEGFGLSVADAMAQGLVCIVGRDGGPAEFVRDGVTGFVVDGQSIDAIRTTLDLLVADPALCRRIGDRARAWAAESLSWDRHCRLCLNEMGLGEGDAGATPRVAMAKAA
ncbi:glycosyltransferase family 4 protein [Sphingobium sp. AR-3-1]|uniref:Glycosyltransferase family 4 protein n=1 Tax=Sphingobium psychrophilum TaxID=2728834 RepID=A0A7X9ZUA8_9SPHN|nr:glycosyltransferase family 4 protein [Sphingobium psychrophilum]NML13045.1 glycosyltransferase family 4 protein [Sphingobium psychrophilum]